MRCGTESPLVARPAGQMCRCMEALLRADLVPTRHRPRQESWHPGALMSCCRVLQNTESGQKPWRSQKGDAKRGRGHEGFHVAFQVAPTCVHAAACGDCIACGTMLGVSLCRRMFLHHLHTLASSKDFHILWLRCRAMLLCHLSLSAHFRIFGWAGSSD